MGKYHTRWANIKPHHKSLSNYIQHAAAHVFLSIDMTVAKHDNSLGVFKTGLDASGYASLFAFDSPESLQVTTNTKHSAHLDVYGLVSN